MKPPASHVDELQSVISAHDLSVTQNIQLCKNQRLDISTPPKENYKMKGNPDSDEDDDAGHKF